MKNKLILIAVLLVLLLGALFLESLAIRLGAVQTGGGLENSHMLDTSGENPQILFLCDGGKSIAALFVLDTDSVVLDLSDNRTMVLTQVVSASGARYANDDESFVFWNKGETAFVTEEDSSVQTYANCVSS